MPDLSRRGFLAASIGAAAAGAVMSIPSATWADLLLAAERRPIEADSRILVLITLYGGNDGLNTVVPFSEAAYFSARPQLAYAADEVIPLDDTYGMNPGMPELANMFRSGSLAIVRGVGYPEPDRSHFRSMDIWQSASLDNDVATGWIGRWLDANGKDPLAALHFGRTVPPLAVGEKTVGALFSREAEPLNSSAELLTALSRPHPSDSPAMRMVCDSYRAAAHVNQGLEPVFREDNPLAESAPHESNRLAAQLDAVAACIAADVPSRIYSVELDGFDTHADELGTQQQLLSELDSAVARFLQQVSAIQRGKDIVVMAYSEFGRRVEANASQGTDHGTAGPVFVIGDRVHGGLYGDDPSLRNLVDDDLKVTTDFRDVYHELLAGGLGTDSEPILGKGRKEIGFLRG